MHCDPLCLSKRGPFKYIFFPLGNLQYKVPLCISKGGPFKYIFFPLGSLRDKPSNYYCSRFARTIKYLRFVSGKKASLFYRLINSYFQIYFFKIYIYFDFFSKTFFHILKVTYHPTLWHLGEPIIYIYLVYIYNIYFIF